MSTRLYSRAEVARLFHVTPPTITDWWQNGKFPPPLRLPGKRAWWHADVIDRMLQESGAILEAAAHGA
jgi:hypothetical protein